MLQHNKNVTQEAQSNSRINELEKKVEAVMQEKVRSRSFPFASLSANAFRSHRVDPKLF